MSWGYGTIRFEGVDGDEEAVREAVRELCSLLAESKLDFDIEIDMHGIENTEEARATAIEECYSCGDFLTDEGEGCVIDGHSVCDDCDQAKHKEASA